MPRIHLKPGRERSLARRHPWVFSGAIDHVEGNPGPGEVVEVRTSQGGFAAWAGYSPDSQIRARVWDWHERTRVDQAFIAARVARAVELRKFLVEPGAQAAIRLANGEADGLPGVVIDRFADTLVLQLTSAAAWCWREAITHAALEATGLERAFERSDADVLALEGLAPRVAVLAGPEPAAPFTIEEAGLAFQVDPRTGHKTGFYLDQRDNRALLRDLAEGREVLDCFCYSGGFAVNALAAGAAHVTAIDSSGEAIAAARRHIRMNALSEARADLIEGDVFQQLRRFRDQGRRFDVIVLDPPKFAPTAAHVERAARAYKDINLWALKLLRPGGLLFTFSCSGGVPRELFQKIVAGAAVDAQSDARILHHMGAAADHPVALAFPEGDYLKGLLCQTV